MEKAGIFKTWKGKKTGIFKSWKGKTGIFMTGR
jgi:viroplasmin and RNaseH domain-containing protein